MYKNTKPIQKHSDYSVDITVRINFAVLFKIRCPRFTYTAQLDIFVACPRKKSDNFVASRFDKKNAYKIIR